MKNYGNEEWLKLDNAAKIYPANASKRDTRVFRFSCQLKKIVDKKTLQAATNKTLEQFPYYKSVLKKGLFWYYLEFSDIKPIVCEEHEPVCAPIYDKNQKNLLFKVTYFKKRINLEVFHALSDGAGAVEFLRALIANYLVLKYPIKFSEQEIDLGYNASISDKMDDSFHKYYDNHGSKKKSSFPIAHTLNGHKHKENRIEIIEGIASTKEIKAMAKKYNTTITILLTAIMMSSINETMTLKERRRPVVITVPVNLRQYFKSLSARNFFGVFNVGYNFSKQQDELEDIISYLNNFFEEKLNYEQMSAIINSMTSLEKNIILRSVPIFIKDIVLKIAYLLSDRISTASLSNVGVINFPKIFDEYIELFDVSISTNRIQMCMCSYNDHLVMSFSSPLKNTNIQKNFFRTLANEGIKLNIASNFPLKEDESFE